MSPLAILLAFGIPSTAVGGVAVSTVTTAERATERADGSLLAFYFMAPNRASYPLLLYLDGSGCGSAEPLLGYFGPFVELGFGVAIPQKRGVAAGAADGPCSKEYMRTNDRRQRLGDAERLLTKGKGLFPGWNGKLVVVGGSEGGALAPEVGLSYDGTIAVASLVGGGWTQAEELKKLKEKELAGSGARPERIRDELARLDAKFAEIRKYPVSSKTWLGPDNTYKRWASYLWYAPVESFVKLTVPVYLAQGTRDSSSPVESADAVRGRFEAAGKKNLTYRRYEGLEHSWTDENGVDRTPQVIGDLLEWLRKFVS